jgi:magnesium transporter
MNTTHRVKVEVGDDYIFCVLKHIKPLAGNSGFELEQVSIYLGKDFVVTFQETHDDIFQPLITRIETAKGRVRKFGADYLMYAAIDIILDYYLVTLEEIADMNEQIELTVLEDPDHVSIEQIHQIKRSLLFIRKAVGRLRDEIALLLREDPPYIKPTTLPYLRDLHDHAIQVGDSIESHRDMTNALLDMYLSSLSHKMNQVMKVLTIIATIFIPLTFIAGIYGMNFEHMPELSYPFAYPIMLAVCGVIAVIMLLGFRRMKWL